MSVAVTHDGRFLLSGSEDKTIPVWNLETGKEMKKLEGHTETMRSVTMTLDGRFIVSSSEDKTV